MTSPDLLEVLTVLLEAGAERVPAENLAWTPEMTPALNHAISMQYVIRKRTGSGTRFSLSESGYKALGLKPPRHMTVSRFILSLFRR